MLLYNYSLTGFGTEAIIFFSFSVGKLMKFDLQIKGVEDDQKKMITFNLITARGTSFLKIY